MAKLFIVDDNPDICNLLTLVFQRAGHEVKSVESGEAAFEACTDYIPDLIVLDVELPGCDGFEVCQQLLARGELSHVPVLFVSSHNEIEYRLKGYEAGGADYICKPVEPGELLSKVELNLTQKAEREAAANQVGSATEAAMTAMKANCELGMVMRYMSAVLSTENFGQLAKESVSFLGEFGLKGSVQLRWSREVENSSHIEPISPLEIALLDQGVDADRIASFGSKVMINSPHASILIKNMWEDDEQRGRFLDHLCIVIEALNARTEALGIMADSRQRREQLESCTGQLENLFEDLDSYINNFSRGLTGMLDGLENQLEDLVVNINLSRTQEDELRDMMSDARGSLEDLSREGDEFDIRCNSMQSAFKQLMH